MATNKKTANDCVCYDAVSPLNNSNHVTHTQKLGSTSVFSKHAVRVVLKLHS